MQLVLVAGKYYVSVCVESNVALPSVVPSKIVGIAVV